MLRRDPTCRLKTFSGTVSVKTGWFSSREVPYEGQVLASEKQLRLPYPPRDYVGDAPITWQIEAEDMRLWELADARLRGLVQKWDDFWTAKLGSGACEGIEWTPMVAPFGSASEDILQEQRELPLLLIRYQGKGWWLFREELYWEDEGYSAEEVRALILEREYRKERKVQRAMSVVAQDQETSRREPIPDDVKVFVWQRDGGKCVKCGSRENLEFDHIIPLAMGGSNTARNLQLLCERCNRAKGGSLV